MKTLLYGVILLVVLGIAGFLYRNVQEQGTLKPPTQTACTLEAKICPDGTTVGRTGPDCAFAACPANNVTVASAHIAFALPDGYVPDEHAASADPTMIGAFIKQGSTTVPVGTIIIHDYPIPSGSTATSVILAHAIKDPSGMPAASMNEFTPKLIGSRTYQSIVLGRFEAVVSSAYFYARTKDVLEFEIVEQNVTDWMKPTLVVSALPEHQAFVKLLNTLQMTDPANQATSTPKSS